MTDLQKLFLRGLKPFFPVSNSEILSEVAKHVNNGGVLVGYEQGAPVAFCIVILPTSPFDIPQVVHFHSEGTKATTHSLVGSVLDFVKRKGYNKLRAVNGSGAPDAIWTRAFRHEGWEIKPVKTVFDFEVKK